jgi:hypothetical protein
VRERRQTSRATRTSEGKSMASPAVAVLSNRARPRPSQWERWPRRSRERPVRALRLMSSSATTARAC